MPGSLRFKSCDFVSEHGLSRLSRDVVIESVTTICGVSTFCGARFGDL